MFGVKLNEKAMKYLKLFLFIASSLILFFACSPLQRVERILKNNPYLISHETVTVRDTVIIPEISYDTIVLTNPTDTIELIKERLYTRIIRYNDTLIVHSECFADTVYLERIVPVEKIKVTQIPGRRESQQAGYIYALFLTLAIILYLLGKSKRRD